MVKNTPQKHTGKIQYDTKVSSVEKQYGVKLHSKKDASMGEFFRDRGYPAFADLLQTKKT